VTGDRTTTVPSATVTNPLPVGSDILPPPTVELTKRASLQEVQDDFPLLNLWSGEAGATALRQVQFLASTASESTYAKDESQFSLATRRKNRMQINKNDRNNNMVRTKARRKQRKRNNGDPVGEGGGVFNKAEFNTLAKEANVSNLKRSDLEVSSTDKREEQVWTALANLELDSTLLFEDFLTWRKLNQTALTRLLLSTPSATFGQPSWTKATIDWLGTIHAQHICGSGSVRAMDFGRKIDRVFSPNNGRL
jgi:hypothetical protein